MLFGWVRSEERGVVEQQDPDDFMTEQTAGNNALCSRESQDCVFEAKAFHNVTL